jgi:hypothetical protein
MDKEAIAAKPGWQTSEFYVTILTALMPIMAALFHRDFSSQIQPFAAISAGLATAAYTVARSHNKHAALKANAAVQVAKVAATASPELTIATQQASPPPQASDIRFANQTGLAAIPVDTLASILSKLDRLIDEQQKVAS